MLVNRTPHELHVWETLQTVVQVWRREVGRDLWAEARLSDAEFSVLAHLYLEGVDGVRPSEYARAIGPHLTSARKWFSQAVTPAQLDARGDALDTLADHLALFADGCTVVATGRDQGRSMV
ncbi:hypothetical protein [Salinibacterium sp.]|uniref:hypothetical protein n=1 Tax=Salinibacterium sp. TaxID=1915057 RepID=UPI00286A32E4|nr:hypothetical protein [Salinibacterium sp.]